MTTPLPPKNIGASCSPKICIYFLEINPRHWEKNIDRDACSIQHHTNSSKFSYYGPLMKAAWSENHHPTYIPPFQRRRFSFPIDINFGWLRKYVTHPYQHKYRNILLLDFNYHSTCVKLPKVNWFLSLQLRSFSPQFQTFTNTIVWTFCLLFVNIIVKFFTCLLVWFATLYFVLSLQPDVYL